MNVRLARGFAMALVFATAPLAFGNEFTPRVISAGGALTEIVYALGAEQQLVGVDSTSTWPTAATALPKVGYFRQLSAEGALSLAPSLVLASEDAGPPETLQQIRQAGVQVKTFANNYSSDGVATKIRAVAEALDRTEQGERLANAVVTEVNAARARIAALDGRQPRVLFVLGVGGGSPVAAGNATAASAMIALAGGINVFEDFEGYKPVNGEAIAIAAPDVLLTVEPASNTAELERQLLAIPGVAATPAGENRRFVAMDGLRLLGFGPRLGETLNQLAGRLHAAPVTAESRDGG
ncbi:MAG: hemin ABC transporter substrate-binding protein [Thiotrichales bacterium]